MCLDFLYCFCQVEVVLPILILGYIWINKRVFMHGIFIVLFGMMLNSALKMTLQVPLPPALGIVEGYAFPSGHMQVAVVLYGWLYVCFDHKFFRMFVCSAVAYDGCRISLFWISLFFRYCRCIRCWVSSYRFVFNGKSTCYDRVFVFNSFTVEYFIGALL